MLSAVRSLMPPVPEGSGYFLVQCNYFIAAAGYCRLCIVLAVCGVHCSVNGTIAVPGLSGPPAPEEKQ